MRFKRFSSENFRAALPFVGGAAAVLLLASALWAAAEQGDAQDANAGNSEDKGAKTVLQRTRGGGVPPALAKAETRKSDRMDLTVHYKNVENEKIKECFETVLEAYEILHPYQITLEQRPIRNTTMQAKPIIGFFDLFGKRKRYKVNLARHVSDSEDIAVRKLPEDVLTGWFAHELGHLVDYEQHSNLGMVRYGIRYLTSHRFKRQAEHTADLIAVQHGFRDEIIATKRFILENDLLGDDYKSRIRRYYMSVEDVEMCVEEDKLPIEPVVK